MNAFSRDRTRVDAWIGRSAGWERGRVLRYAFGLRLEEDRYGALVDETVSTPRDRTLFYPWLEIAGVRDRFVEARDLDSIRRTEDWNLGLQWRARVGRSLGAFGGETGAWIYEGEIGRGGRTARGDWWKAAAALSGRRRDGNTENRTAALRMRWDRRTFGRHLFHVGFRLENARALDADRQLLIGGDTGLRGYPLRYLEGETVAVVGIEQRFYTDWHLWRLARIGAAVFFDAGRAWSPDYAGTRDGWLRDVGFGLRVGSSRSASGSMIHIDLAFPLDRTDDLDAVQFLIRSRETF